MLTQTPSTGSGSWIHASQPTPEEIARLTREFGVPPEYIAHSLDKRERPRILERGDSALVVLRASRPRNARSGPLYATVPVGVVLAPQQLVTICREPLRALDTVAASPPASPGMPHPHHALLFLLEASAADFLQHLETIEDALSRLEGRLPKIHNAEVIELLRYQKSLVYLASALRGNELVLTRLQKSELLDLRDPDDLRRLEDVQVELKQAIEVSDLTNATLTTTTDAFSSIFSNNLNEVMRQLTAASVLVSLPVFLAGLYGMNVALPGAGTPYAFWMIVLGSLLGGAGLAFLFRRIGWL